MGDDNKMNLRALDCQDMNLNPRCDLLKTFKQYSAPREGDKLADQMRDQQVVRLVSVHWAYTQVIIPRNFIK
jgi:hypothetical protein